MRNVLASLPRTWPAALLAIALGGCGQGSMPLERVSGTVTLDGQPISSGVVHFLPEAGPAAVGTLDEHGQYALSTYQSGDGAVVGTHQVYFVAPPVEDESFSEADYMSGRVPRPRSRQPFVPVKYLAARTSELTAEVVRGTNRLDFELASQ